MFLQNFIHKKITATFIFLLAGFTLLAQDVTVVKATASGNNLLATLLIITAFVLLFVLYGMGQVLIALSRQLLDKEKKVPAVIIISALIILSLFPGNIFAQDILTESVVKNIPNYGGLPAASFYFLTAVIATEVVAIFFLFFSIRRIYAELIPAKAAVVAKESRLMALWIKLDKKLLTKAIPVEQEADSLLDHNYDGIQELDNALPPWWKYGFIVTIGIAIVYLLHFHVVGNGKNPTEEYAMEMNNATIEKEIYEANNKDKIDELNVPLANATGINKGKEFYMANCIACHGQLGEGGAGPNLTDNYWLHKGSLNDIYQTIKIGYPDKGMQSWATKFNPKEMSELASFIATLKGTNPPGAKGPQGELFSVATSAIPSDVVKPGRKEIVKL